MTKRILEITEESDFDLRWPDLETSLFFEEGLTIELPENPDIKTCNSIKIMSGRDDELKDLYQTLVLFNNDKFRPRKYATQYKKEEMFNLHFQAVNEYKKEYLKQEETI